MLTFTTLGDTTLDCADELVLPFEQRSRRRLRCRLASGDEAAVVVPRGTILRDGDVLVSETGPTVRVRAAAEPTLRVEHDDPLGLVRCAYHLGNRHVQVEVGEDRLRILDDPVLARMLVGLGAIVAHEEAPFEPEAGAYGHGDHLAGHGAAHT